MRDPKHKVVKKSSLRSIKNSQSNNNYKMFMAIYMLYQEGVEPTRAEIYVKLREMNLREEIIHNALNYYRDNPDWYKVTINESSFIVHLKNEPAGFTGWVDMKSPVNCYSEVIWIVFIEYILSEITAYGKKFTGNNINKDHIVQNSMFNHTRYTLAKYIKEHGPVLIREMRIGEIAHLVQLVLHQNILRYEDTMIIPNAMSHEVFCEENSKKIGYSSEIYEAISILDPKLYDKYSIRSDLNDSGLKDSKESLSLSTCSTVANSTDISPLNEDIGDTKLTFEEKKKELEAIIVDLLENHGRVLMSQVRSMILIKYEKDIKPISFGYNKLSDLLLEHFSHVCCLIRQRNRHVYLEKPTNNFKNSEIAIKPNKQGFHIYKLSQTLFNFNENLYRHSLGRNLDDLDIMSLKKAEINNNSWTVDDLNKYDEYRSTLEKLYFS